MKQHINDSDVVKYYLLQIQQQYNKIHMFSQI